MESSPIMSCQKEGEKVEVATDFFFLGSKTTEVMKSEDHYFLAGKLWQT